MGIIVDTSEFDAGIKKFELGFTKATTRGLYEVGSEIMRLSSFEVPHDTGHLQSSGGIEPSSISMTNPKKGFVVGYNKVYAAKLHEHPEYNFQKGRKAKYLEDPIKQNLRTFREYLARPLKAFINSGGTGGSGGPSSGGWSPASTVGSAVRAVGSKSKLSFGSGVDTRSVSTLAKQSSNRKAFSNKRMAARSR